MLRGLGDDQPQGLWRPLERAFESAGVLVSDKILLEFEVSAIRNT
jgi:hypothetical protein